MKYLIIAFFLFLPFSLVLSQDKKINVIVIGAHPDDPDGTAGGTAIKFAELGHNVLFVSLTNGDAGHQSKGGGALAKIRRGEAQEAGKRLGVTYRVLDHRNTALLLQDAAYMVIVPNVASDTPPLKRNPVFLYAQDRFQKPYPFIPDIAIDISDVLDRKIYAMAAHESQYFEWLPWTVSQEQNVPKKEKERIEWLKSGRRRTIIPAVKEALEKWYGKEKADKITDAEAFEICEYGRQPNESEIRELFPMIGK